ADRAPWEPRGGPPRSARLIADLWRCAASRFADHRAREAPAGAGRSECLSFAACIPRKGGIIPTADATRNSSIAGQGIVPFRTAMTSWHSGLYMNICTRSRGNASTTWLRPYLRAAGTTFAASASYLSRDWHAAPTNFHG